MSGRLLRKSFGANLQVFTILVSRLWQHTLAFTSHMPKENSYTATPHFFQPYHFGTLAVGRKTLRPMTKLDKRGGQLWTTPWNFFPKKTNRLLFGRAFLGLVWGFQLKGCNPSTDGPSHKPHRNVPTALAPGCWMHQVSNTTVENRWFDAKVYSSNNS